MRFARFLVVGLGSNGVFAGCYWVLGAAGLRSSLAYVSSYALSLIANVLLTTSWVFGRKPTLLRSGSLLSYHVCIGTLGGLLVEAIRTGAGCGHWLALLPVLAITIPLNYLISGVICTVQPSSAQ